MAERSLTSVLKSLVYPTTVRIAGGGLTAEEGKHFQPSNVLTLYGCGLRVYVPPSTNAVLRERCRTADTTKRTIRKHSDDGDEEYSNTDNLFTKNIFVSEKVNLKDNKFAGKVYRDVAELLSDSPFSVKANKSFFVYGDGNNPNEVHKISEGDVIYIDPHLDGAKTNMLRGHVHGERVAIPLSNKSINVTALPESTSEATASPAAHMMYVNYGKPKEMVYEDQDIQETYQIEVGFNVIPLKEQPVFSVCCSERYRKDDIEDLDNGMLKVQNIWCFNFNEHSIKTVTVQVLETHVESSFRPAFGKEVGRDENEFSLYNLYGKECSEDYLEPTQVPIPKSKTGATQHATDKPPPLPIRKKDPTRESVTLKGLPVAPPPPPPTKEMLLPSPNPYKHHESFEEEINNQPSSPTFINSSPRKERTTTTKLKLQESVTRSLNDPLSDQGPNSTDEEKMSPPAEGSDKMSDTRTSSVSGVTEIDTKDMKDMTVSELAMFLETNKLDHMANICKEEMIDGVLLLSLDKEDFKTEPFNLTSYQCTKLIKLIQGHRPKW